MSPLFFGSEGYDAFYLRLQGRTVLLRYAGCFRHSRREGSANVGTNVGTDPASFNLDNVLRINVHAAALGL